MRIEQVGLRFTAGAGCTRPWYCSTSLVNAAVLALPLNGCWGSGLAPILQLECSALECVLVRMEQVRLLFAGGGRLGLSPPSWDTDLPMLFTLAAAGALAAAAVIAVPLWPLWLQSQSGIRVVPPQVQLTIRELLQPVVVLC